MGRIYVLNRVIILWFEQAFLQEACLSFENEIMPRVSQSRWRIAKIKPQINKIIHLLVMIL
jgi:hypothetical protein